MKSSCAILSITKKGSIRRFMANRAFFATTLIIIHSANFQETLNLHSGGI